MCEAKGKNLASAMIYDTYKQMDRTQ